MRTMLLANKRDKRSNAFWCDRYCVSAPYAMMSICRDLINFPAARTVCVFVEDDF